MIDPQAFIDSASAVRKTKIVATLGPASWDSVTIRKLIKAGANVFRLNFSHGTHEQHSKTLSAIRDAASDLGQTIAILQDLSGPKIRISNVNEEAAVLSDEQELSLIGADGELSTANCIRVEALNPVEVLQLGQRVLLADGIIELVVIEAGSGVIRCRAVRGGRLRSRVGIAFPDSEIKLPATTQKDLLDLAWGIANEVDFVAVSFVQEAQDIQRIRKVIHDHQSRIKIIPKIERRSALQNIEAILAVSDGLMVARGDLGIEVPLQTVPLIQRELVRRAIERGLPVIVATQLLHSMVTSVRPTRAEVTDVSVAVIEGADAVMLSEETAIGDYPAEAVAYLDKITRTIEAQFDFVAHQVRLGLLQGSSTADASAFSACAAADKVCAGAIIACTRTGESPRLIAKYRPEQLLYAATADQTVLNQLSLVWGVQPVRCALADSRESEVDLAISAVAAANADLLGGQVVVTSGLLRPESNSAAVIEIRNLQ